MRRRRKPRPARVPDRRICLAQLARGSWRLWRGAEYRDVRTRGSWNAACRLRAYIVSFLSRALPAHPHFRSLEGTAKDSSMRSRSLAHSPVAPAAERALAVAENAVG